MKKELELYIHIPFCVKKCAYCDFLSGPQSKEVIDKYVAALIQEIKVYAACQSMPSYDMCNNLQFNTMPNPFELKDTIVTSIFLGGGTPSILEIEQIKQIFTALRETFQISGDAEITIEANPGTVTKEKLETYQQVGINRISFGLQSTNNEELKMLGRIHTYEEFFENYQLARECGFDNINIDLISAIPKQTIQSWEETLQKVIELAPEHVSSYSLIIEEGTPFAVAYGKGGAKAGELPSEEDERLMYQQTEELLGQARYHRYEISNYAKEGKECRHNLGYWERKNYLGLGLGASSLIDNVRFHNTQDLKNYLEHSTQPEEIRCEEEVLSQTAQMEEFVFLGMRKMKGISLREFEATFGICLDQCYGANIKRMEATGLVEEKDGYLRLTEKGIDISNYVFAEILYE